MSHKRPAKSKLEEMFTTIQFRGQDASGFATIDEHTMRVVKAPIKAEELITKKSWRKLKTLPPIMLLHTRAATQGDKKENTNNHPIKYKNYAAVHNGVIQNEAEFNVPFTTVDSLAILKSWHENQGDITKVFKSLEGSFAVGLIDSKQPNKLVLFRHTSPIEMMLDKENEILYFASTTYAVEKMKETYDKKVKGFPVFDRYQSIVFPNNTFMEITREEGLINRVEDLSAKTTVYYTSYNKTYRSKSYNDSRFNPQRSSYHDRYFGSEDEWDLYDGWDTGYCLPANREPEPIPEKKASVSMLFLEYLVPQNAEHYRLVNKKLETSDYRAIECEHCEQPTLINNNETKPICDNCSKEIKKVITYVN
jgi:asparagine synthetase B (glutamine-hydrolysing)